MKVSSITLLLITLVLLLFGSTAQAQNGAFVTVGSGAVAQLGQGPPQGQLGRPYSAVRESETVQTLSDGTHITRKSHTRLYRDSQGRTRTEMFMVEGPNASQDQPTQIIINDPVEGVNYFLNPRNHSGTRNVVRMIPTFQTVPAPQPSAKPAVNVEQARPLPQELRAQSKSEDLGTQMIDGVWAHGIRTTTTIPLNAQGNDRPLVTVFENWSSDELQVQLLSKRSDPRGGETTERLTNIDRSEPDPSLFRPPADYTITEPQRSPDVR
jgi:hypothetical protein